MDRHTIIVANRLPYHLVSDTESEASNTALNGSLVASDGGLASALRSLHEKQGNLWIGESDLPASETGTARAAEYERRLADAECVPVYLTEEEQRGYYEQFSNSTLWPLFHDFPQYAQFDADSWEVYVQVNRKFCDAVAEVAKPGDIIWVHDYHLMLLPQMLREAIPDALIGFFLHIPFPDYETFRMLPWRAQVLEGVLGADLVGFHTYDYVRRFLSSCVRVLGLDNRMGSMLVDGRQVRADVFPLGIDYERYARAGRSERTASIGERLIPVAGQDTPPMRSLLSVGRLDYTKGIPELLRAYDTFLERYPEWRQRVQLSLVTVPSREVVPSYAELKREVDELVGRINGKFARPHWNPIRYYYRSLDFDELIAAYRACDVMLVTPLRDGMNLVCKEYLAVRDGGTGVLVLSEMAGAAGELSEALLVNPFDRDSIVEAIHRALTMPEPEQRHRNGMMQRRLSRYTSERWANEFIDALGEVRDEQRTLDARLVGPDVKQRMHDDYLQAGKAGSRRTILLDYDGTLVPFDADPASVPPDDELLSLLGRLSADPLNDVAILSGRDRETLSSWFSKLNIDLVAEHGAWLWTRNGNLSESLPADHSPESWMPLAPLDDSWMPRARELLQDFVDRTPGSLLEEKGYSLVWHYRACNRELAERRVAELRSELTGVVGDMGLQLAFGNKVVEIKLANIDKGSAAYRWFSREGVGFTLVAGDDMTDEDMFRTAPDNAWTVKVGADPTQARWSVRDCHQMRSLLENLLEP
ncbi:MAG: bifunctional alpha,alpha-trehalose-phosphate synthase (UDP-forming)/trehalose-phosphatase [Eggerthellaceae bacterium]|jgi:trehalose 6-phosphate synthase/phosphatase